MSRRRPPSALRRAWLAFALLALALGQMLGAMHAIVHAPRLLAFASAAGETDARSTSVGGVAALFAGHGHADHACDLYDQLGHADVMPSVPPAWVAPAPPVGAPAMAPRACHAARLVAGFLARGPPSLSS